MNTSTYKYEIPDNMGDANASTAIEIINNGASVRIRISRIRSTTSCTEINIRNRTTISMIQAAMNEEV